MSRGTFIDEENLCFIHCAITDKEKITPHYLKTGKCSLQETALIPFYGQLTTNGAMLPAKGYNAVLCVTRVYFQFQINYNRCVGVVLFNTIIAS